MAIEERAGKPYPKRETKDKPLLLFNKHINSTGRAIGEHLLFLACSHHSRIIAIFVTPSLGILLNKILDPLQSEMELLRLFLELKSM